MRSPRKTWLAIGWMVAALLILAAPVQGQNASKTTNGPPPTTHGPVVADGEGGGDAISWSVAGAAVIVAVAGLAMETVRYRLLVAAVPLFTRLEGDRLLDHVVRDRLMHLISSEPGVHYGGLRRDTGLGHGLLAHHLVMMERARLIRSARDGVRRRFYPTGRPSTARPPTSVAAQAILEAIRTDPGCSVGEVAQRSGRSKQVVSYHLPALESAGWVRVQREGRIVRCFPVERASG